MIEALLATQAYEGGAVGGRIAAFRHGAGELCGGGGIELIAPDRFRTGDLAQRAIGEHGEEARRFAEMHGFTVQPDAKYTALAHDAGAFSRAAHNDDDVATTAPVRVDAEYGDVRSAIIGADRDLFFGDGRGEIIADLGGLLRARGRNAEQKHEREEEALHSQPPRT